MIGPLHVVTREDAIDFWIALHEETDGHPLPDLHGSLIEPCFVLHYDKICN